MYQFAQQQQTSTCRRQNFRYTYLKFSAEKNELTRSFQNPQKKAGKLKTLNNAWKP